jgi:hypothetical protein
MVANLTSIARMGLEKLINKIYQSFGELSLKLSAIAIAALSL